MAANSYNLPTGERGGEQWAMAGSDRTNHGDWITPWLWLANGTFGTVLALARVALSIVLGIWHPLRSSLASTDAPLSDVSPIATPHPMPPVVLPPTPDPSPEPAVSMMPPALVVVPPVGRVLYQDDMSGARRVWPAGTFGASFVQYYLDGEYHIENRHPLDLRNVDVPLRYQDMVYEVDLRKVEGRDDGFYGLMFRLHELESYFFLISGDGQYQLVRHVGHGGGQGHPGGGNVDGWDTEGMIAATPATAGVINLGNARNRLKVYTIGPVLTIYINDQYIAQVVETKPDFHWEGMIGLYVDGGIHLAVDAVRVFEPGS